MNLQPVKMIDGCGVNLNGDIHQNHNHIDNADFVVTAKQTDGVLPAAKATVVVTFESMMPASAWRIDDDECCLKSRSG
jgi:hypothetical protein